MACLKLVFPPQKLNSNEPLQLDVWEFKAAFSHWIPSVSFVQLTVQTSKLNGLEETHRKRLWSRNVNFARPFSTNNWITGQTVCYECEKGKYQDKAGKATCIPCPLGYFQNKREQTSCLKCEKGHYQNATGETTCKLCQKGSFSGWAIYCTWVSMITDWDTFYTT